MKKSIRKEKSSASSPTRNKGNKHFWLQALLESFLNILTGCWCEDRVSLRWVSLIPTGWKANQCSVSESSTWRITYHLLSYYIKKNLSLSSCMESEKLHWMGKKLSSRELTDFPRDTWNLRGVSRNQKYFLAHLSVFPSLYQCVTRERIIVRKFSLSKNIWLCPNSKHEEIL